MATSNAPSNPMIKKAANDGDKLKHYVEHEVLGRCTAWDSLIYAETHAGQGEYFAADQAGAKDTPHIKKLLENWTLVSGRNGGPLEAAPGGRYYHTLHGWWSGGQNQDGYPGSVVGAARFLQSKRVKAEFRVTEAVEATYLLLKEAVRDYDIMPKHADFQSQISWLTGGDSLVLLIDPFAFNEDYGADREAEVSEGGMDKHTLEQLLTPCWYKEAAVVLLWCGFPHSAGTAQKAKLKEWLPTKAATHGAEVVPQGTVIMREPPRVYEPASAGARGAWERPKAATGSGSSTVRAWPSDGASIRPPSPGSGHAT
jgi:hypothetical protein